MISSVLMKGMKEEYFGDYFSRAWIPFVFFFYARMCCNVFLFVVYLLHLADRGNLNVLQPSSYLLLCVLG